MSLFHMNAYWLTFLTRMCNDFQEWKKRTLWYVPYYISIPHERVLTNYFDQNMQWLPGREKRRTLWYVPYYISISYERVLTNYFDQNVQWLPGRKKKKEHCGTFPVSISHECVLLTSLTRICNDSQEGGKKEHCGTFPMSLFHMNAYWLISLTRICNPPQEGKKKEHYSMFAISLFSYASWLIFWLEMFSQDLRGGEGKWTSRQVSHIANFWLGPISKLLDTAYE